MEKKIPNAIIFDMDGTLFETDTLLMEVHKRVFDTLREEGLYTYDTPPVERLLSCLGMLLDDIWKTVMPESTVEARQRADELLLQYELEGLKNGEGRLYPHVVETLSELRGKGVKLYVASNGLEAYVKGVAIHKGIAKLFDGIYSAGEYQTASKVDLVAQLLKDHHGEPDHEPEKIWMVGDRASDVEAGKVNQIYTVGCAYSTYGDSAEIAEADWRISDFRELLLGQKTQ